MSPISPDRTDYGYNAVGALETVALPNGVTSTYTYNGRNHLTDLVAAVNGSTLASFRYTLRASGRRASLDERIGAAQVAGSARRTTWSYDEVYRLIGETVTAGTGDPAVTLGNLGYTYDAVGNRLTRTSTNPVLAPRTSSYNLRDQLATDTYDANGNTKFGLLAPGSSLPAPSFQDTYDTENRLIQRTEGGTGGRTITVLYDADGNRVKKSVTTPGSGTVTTYYLVDTLNPTGYAQVIDEHTQVGSGPITLSKSYAYGLDLISRSAVNGPSSVVTHYFGYDGLGSVRYLTSETGTITAQQRPMPVALSSGRKCTDWIVTAINPMIDHDSFAQLSFEKLFGRRCPMQEREEAETAIGSVVGYALGRGAFLFSKPEQAGKVAEVILDPAELPHGMQDGNHALGVLGLGFKFGDKLDVILSQLEATGYQADELDDRIICELTTGNNVGYRLVMVVLKSAGLSHLDMISFGA